MKKILAILAIMFPLLVSAQRMEVYVYKNYEFLSLYAYGLPREVVKTNAEMRASRTNDDGTGVMRRHHTSKRVDQAVTSEGYDANEKVSFAFIIAPYIINESGQRTTVDAPDSKMSWDKASGWLSNGTGYSVNPEPSGCAAYQGPGGLDDKGDWRLPTQREMQMMVTVIEQAMELQDSHEVEGEAVVGKYWTATEFSSSYDVVSDKLEYIDSADKVWIVDNSNGQTTHESPTATGLVRCVKDIYEDINGR